MFSARLDPGVHRGRSRSCRGSGVLKLGILRRLRGMLLASASVHGFTSAIVGRDNAFLGLSSKRLSGTLGGGRGPMSRPRSVGHGAVLVSVPASRKGSSLGTFSGGLGTTLRNTFKGTAPKDAVGFGASDSQVGRVAIVSVQCYFPVQTVT